VPELAPSISEFLPANARAFLAISGGSAPANRAPLSGNRAIVGRAPEADIRLDRNTVSRQHAELFRDPFGRWWVRDLGSRNGVRFGELKIAERALHSGDTFQIGEFQLRFESGEPASASTLSTIRTSELDAEIRDLAEMEAPKLAASHLSVLIEFGRQLVEEQDPAERLRKLCRLMVKEEFGGRFAMALRISAEGAADLLCETQLSPAWVGPTQVSGRLLTAVARTRRPALASNCTAGPDVVQMTVVSPTPPAAAVGCPLSSDADRVLYVSLPPDRGSAEWLATASLAAEQFRAAESVWAARRQAQLNAAIEQELQQASRLQAALVPRNLMLPGLEIDIAFHPCRWVGGDYVGASAVADGRVMLAVADVCGKGLAAALVASSLHTLMFASLRAGSGLPELMNSINAYVCQTLGEQRFVTMAAVLLDPASGTIATANAGHPPPLVVRPDGWVRQLPSQRNFPLGVSDDPISCQEERLESGEALLLYTDGVSELNVSATELLGVEGLQAELARLYLDQNARPLADIVRRLETRLEEMQRGRVAADDLTFLMVRRSAAASA